MKRVVILGNAPIKPDLTTFIDNSECVIRFNDCKNYRVNTGKKTDILFLNNTGNPSTNESLSFLLKNRNEERVGKNLPYVKKASEVVFVRPNAKFCKLFTNEYISDNNPLKVQQLHEIQLERDLENEIVKALYLEDKEIDFIDNEFYVNVWNKLLRYGKTKAIMPSTGVLGIESLLDSTKYTEYKKYIAGFSLEGWEGHPWELERCLINDYIERRVLVPLDDSGATSKLSPRHFFNGKNKSNVATQKPIQELFIVCNLKYGILEKIRKKYPASRTVYWDNRELDKLALQRAADLALHVIAEDNIVQIVSEALEREITYLGELDPSIANQLKTIGMPLAHDELPPYKVNGGSVLFCPINDTHVKTFLPISKLLGDSKYLLYGDTPFEKAEEMLLEQGIDYYRGVIKTITKLRPSVIVLGKDWSPASRRLMALAHFFRIPNICLQEGPTDFDRDQRMQRCDFPIVQGAVMLKYLEQQVYFITGNARFDPIKSDPLPPKPMVMINSNFWGKSEQRGIWLNDVVSACREVGIDFFISRHPRDTGELPGLPAYMSGPNKIHQHIKDSSLVITQHSSVIYEALMSGRSVICHDPKIGKVGNIIAFDKDKSGAFPVTYTTSGLINEINRAIESRTAEQQAKINTFLDWHCGTRDSRMAIRCASAIAAISNQDSPLPSSGFRWLRSRLMHSNREVFSRSTCQSQAESK